jgi:hypothetical protein
MKTTLLNVSTAGPHAELAQILNDEIFFHCKTKLNIARLENNCVGDFKTYGFYNSCLSKIQNIIEYLKALDDDDCLIYLDSDIYVKDDIVSIMKLELEDYDAAFQQDSPNALCGGMFICRKNNKTLQLFQEILDVLVAKPEYYQNEVSDQTALNEMLTTDIINYKALSERFTTYGNIGEGVWDPNCAPFELPENLVAFHANFTVGIDNKILLLNAVRYSK